MRPTLPAGWQWVPLSRLVSKIEAGKSFKCDERPPVESEHGIVKVSAVTWGTYDEQESKTITDAEKVNEANLIRPGDFLFSRANTLQLVGACVLVSATRKRLLLSDKILRLVMPDGLKPWLLWFLRSADGRRQIEALSTGNQESMRNIGQERIGQIEVPLPAEPTMQRIVSRIEELFSEIDEGERALQRVGRLVERYRQSVLKAAVTGELTREWRTDHAPRASQESSSSEEGSLPLGWMWTTVARAGEVRLGRQRAPQHHQGDHMRPYLRVANVFEDRLDLRDVKEMNFTPKEFETYALRRGDILLNEGQSPELVGRPAMYRDEIPGCCYQKTLLRFRARPGVLPDFALLVFRHYLHSGRFRRSVNITTSIAHLAAERFEPIEFPLPPEAEQAVIVDNASALLGRLTHLEAELQSQRSASRALREATLKAAFSGQLVPQDPGDEPAAALLARLAAQAAGAPIAPKRGGRPRRQPTTT